MHTISVPPMDLSRPTVEVLSLPNSIGLALPAYASDGAAGADLRAAIPEHDPLRLEPMQRMAVPTGIALSIPRGYEAQLRPRSGLALHHGLTLLNSPATIDSDYRGEIFVLIINLGSEAITIERGDRIAQLVIAPALQCVFQQKDALTQTKRGTKGFGATGKR